MEKIRVPEGKTKEGYLRELVYEGLKTRYPAAEKNVFDRDKLVGIVIEASSNWRHKMASGL